MYSAGQVIQMIGDWKNQGCSKPQIAAKAAEVCLGWPYVFGAWGIADTVSNRKKYYNYGNISAGDKKLIVDHCPILKGKASKCDGCNYYPNGERVLTFDCRGFTHWILDQVGIDLSGQGATSQWNTASNWEEKGLIKDMPRNKVCCVFRMVGKSMEHTGMHVGNGRIIHCSVEVKEGTTSEFTHYAIPKGLEGEFEPMPGPEPVVVKPTLRKGAVGEYVTLLQTKLIQMGYNLGSYGADGKFGAKTEDAVKAFQKSRGLDADGVVGPKTWEALETVASEPKLTYSAIVKGLSLEQANEIRGKYPNVNVIEE